MQASIALQPTSFRGAISLLLHHPGELLIRRWNWKSALTSALIRGSIFFFTNLTAGFEAASATFLVEFSWRCVTSGFWGSLTQIFRTVKPIYVANLTVMLGLPLMAHAIEFTIHFLRGTPNLRLSILASIAFSALSTFFTLFAMRRGALVVGEGQDSFLHDLARMPRIIFEFLISGPRAIYKGIRGALDRKQEPER